MTVGGGRVATAWSGNRSRGGPVVLHMNASRPKAKVRPSFTTPVPVTPGTPSNQTPAMPRATHCGGITLANERQIDCYVLDDQRRVLSLRKLADLFDYEGNRVRQRGGLQWPRFVMQKAIWSRLEQRFTMASNLPFEFELPDGGVGLAFKAELLVELCEAWVDAAVNGELRAPHAPMVSAALKILRGVLQVGLTALIDEATGYQKQREPGSLQAQMLALVVQDGYTGWKKRFPDEFFKELYRLYEIPGDPLGPRPGCVAGKINFVIYERLCPRLMAFMNTANPPTKGRRRRKNHQHLTELGRAALRMQLIMVIRMMVMSRTRLVFEDWLAKLFPREHEQLTLGLELAIYEHLSGAEFSEPDTDE
jgi:hypothetical protein